MSLFKFLVAVLPKTKTEGVTDAVAVAAATSWAWMPNLQEWHDILAVTLQVFGILWLAVQIWVKLHPKRGE